MLLIGQPKSATTSLCFTLADMLGLKYKLGIPGTKYDKNCPGFSGIQQLHDNMVQRSDKFIHDVLSGKKTIFKEHLLPIDKHLFLLDKYQTNCIVLLRNPEHSYDAYVRHDKIHYEKFGKHINLPQIKKDLNEFYNKYKFFCDYRDWALCVEYDDLILNYEKNMKNILTHIGVNCKIKPLYKKKYTGVGEKRLNDK